MADLDLQDNLDGTYTLLDYEEEQTVTIPLSQYTDWMLKAHTLSEVKKLCGELTDEVAIRAICTLVN